MATEATRNEKVTAHCVLTAGGLYSSLVLKIVCSPDATSSHEQAIRHNNHLCQPGKDIRTEHPLTLFFFGKEEFDSKRGLARRCLSKTLILQLAKT